MKISETIPYPYESEVYPGFLFADFHSPGAGHTKKIRERQPLPDKLITDASYHHIFILLYCKENLMGMA